MGLGALYDQQAYIPKVRDTFRGRMTEMGHAVESFDSDLGIGRLGFQFAATQL